MTSSKIILLLALASVAQAQTISTIAGGGPTDSMQALTVALGPVASGNTISTDGAGNIYVAAGALNRIFKISTGGIVTTVAGNGSASFAGDGGAPTSASLSSPSSVASDAGGTLYIADTGNRRIRKVAGGVITTIAGTGTAADLGDGGQAVSASFVNPIAVVLDKSGNLFIIDGNVVREIAGGVITTVAGNGSYGFAGDTAAAVNASLAGPSGIAVDTNGNLYIADRFNNRVREVVNGTINTIAGNGTPTWMGDGQQAVNASLNLPAGVKVGADGSVYIADSANHRVRKVTAGVISSIAGNGTNGYSGDSGQATAAMLSFPFGVTLDPTGNTLYIATQGDSRIRQVTGGVINTTAGNGNLGYSGEGGQAKAAQLWAPSGVAYDRAGNLYIADSPNNRVLKVAGGIITTVAGNGTPGYSGDGHAATAAQLNNPTGIALDNTGNLFIADSSNNVIREVAGGVITTVTGTGAQGHSGDGGMATAAQLWFPTGVAVDANGSLYIADTGSNRVRKVSAGAISNFAGSAASSAGYGGDGGPATSALLAFPHGVAVDSNGVVYIADTSNDLIRVVAAGNINTLAGNRTPGYSGDGGPAALASIYEPVSVAVDASGNVYFDAGFGRVRRVSGGVITTLAGNDTFTFGFSGDGGPAARAQLNYPTSVAADSAGDVAMADSMNGRVRFVTAPAAVTADLVAPSGGSGAQTFTFRFSDPKGWQDLDVLNVLINSALDGRQSCYLAYSRPQNTLYLVPDNGTGLLPGLLLNGSGTLSNSQCTIVGAGTSASGMGNTLTLTLNMTFTPAFAGNKIIYIATRDLAQDNSGWQALGTWTVPGAPTTQITVNGMTPARGVGTGQTFTFTFTDTKGFHDLGVMNVLVNSTLDGRQACYLAFSQPANILYLVNDAGTALLPAITLGSGSVSNSQCTINGAGSSASGTGTNNFTLTLNISFPESFAGNKVTYLAARDSAEGNNTGWQSLGSWTVQ
jgi:sugar lactone lactonase YvrE